jgi:L-threonylcarbamoyladenylate synthase
LGILPARYKGGGVTDNRIRAADEAGIVAAAASLRAGGLVAVPTETVYGLAARADDGTAVARIYTAKGRPSFNPLIVHVTGMAQAATLVEISPLAARLMDAFWPGPLTLVLPLRAGAPVAGLVTAGLDTLALRCPAHPVMQALIAAVGPLAAPSANASGRISPTRAAHVAASLGPEVGLILDGGACVAGVESTIVLVEGEEWRLLRPGAVALEDVEAAITSPLAGEVERRRSRPGRGVAPRVDTEGGATPLPGRPAGVSRPPPKGGGESSPGALPESDLAPNGDGILAPGMLASHYAPRQPVRLGAETAGAHEFHIGFGAVAGDASLSASGDLAEAAARLFDLLHIAEASGRAGIAVAPVPRHGLGLAINDRLARAAAPRDDTAKAPS